MLWETQRRGALADRTLDTERVLRICDPSAFAGSAEYVGEQVVQASLVRTAAASARQVRELADDEWLAPARLIGHALHALGPLDEVRRRWRTVAAEPKPPHVDHQQDSTPPAARIDAALSRSRPHRTAAPPVMAPTTASPPSARDRHHRRSPS